MFEDREDAARKLAVKLKKIIQGRGFLVAALTRGGVVLGKVIADYFKLPLEALVVKKLGAPQNPELAIGAVGPKGATYFDQDLIQSLGVTNEYKKLEVAEKSKDVESLKKILKGDRKPLDFSNKKVILVDDGVATGATVMCAYNFLKKEKAKEIILATPVISQDTFNIINEYFDLVVTLNTASEFYAVGEFYRNFPQVSDEEVVMILNSRKEKYLTFHMYF